ncbi:hypothetical protein H7691_06570 [Stenotrophomonas sp. CW117]|uniref:hypothetical protein n=1 Tax=Stenotrophomonas TaxID=40323 RepID=UPI0017862B03|nr:hypothetical protein [Stenotrophomonas sp. CW117]QOF99773.1 hypothetical protein H7691_06570 [Stenotrophomonas sp. CW117]
MNTTVWLIRFIDRDGTQHATVHTHNAIGDFRGIDPHATVEELDALALSDLLAADRAFDCVVADTKAHHHRIAEHGGYARLEAPTTRELCERYIAAEIDRAAAMDRCTPTSRPAIQKGNTDISEVAA